MRCGICPHECLVKEGKTGLCKARKNTNGVLYALTYGNPCSTNVDPVEKKPLYHFYPGNKIFSMATAGCNFRCQNCQNWSISQASPEQLPSYDMMPDEVVRYTKAQNCRMIAFTYTEPTVFFEYMLETCKLARQSGIKTAMISNGFINPKPLIELSTYLDAANIDLKCIDPEIHHKLTGANVEPVLNTLLTLKERGVWLEITHLLIPEYSDEEKLIEKMCNWLVKNEFQNTPIHFSRFFPTYQLTSLPPTPEQSLHRAADIARKTGMNFVYTGNLHQSAEENTMCPACGTTLIERSGYQVIQNHLQAGKCPRCQREIPGIWK